MKSVRAFIAVNIDEALREKIVAFVSGLTLSAVKWVRAENLHLTLKFLADISESETAKVVDTLNNTLPESKAFDITLNGIGAFPNERRPKVIWVGITNADGLVKLQGTIEDSLSEAGFKREERDFSPHLTIGRVKTTDGLSDFSRQTQKLKDAVFGDMTVDTVYLMKSELFPAGPKYSELKSFKLQKQD
ncbi:MAG: RNA 2',3'-cyclic phosphodiesterase [Nitrospirae bacterium]|nr:RNA 2',3'-cyclic phosphodiesterase [Nitrospirota bacterium]MBF0536313.1 RNA 2',3'-cyclic phosphodiesterase [Nitrospirota bacterium]MBF0618254.1 RNA 2',3'-cyclic phosphodiesterase [Nitrospirota bacterium]